VFTLLSYELGKEALKVSNLAVSVGVSYTEAGLHGQGSCERNRVISVTLRLMDSMINCQNLIRVYNLVLSRVFHDRRFLVVARNGVAAQDPIDKNSTKSVLGNVFLILKYKQVVRSAAHLFIEGKLLQ
jgi:hypothetical protein